LGLSYLIATLPKKHQFAENSTTWIASALLLLQFCFSARTSLAVAFAKAPLFAIYEGWRK
jgi:hypothetical protein